MYKLQAVFINYFGELMKINYEHAINCFHNFSKAVSQVFMSIDKFQ